MDSSLLLTASLCQLWQDFRRTGILLKLLGCVCIAPTHSRITQFDVWGALRPKHQTALVFRSTSVSPIFV
jgi:hypothetical protein